MGNGFGEDQKAHEIWDAAKDAYVAARGEYEIFDLACRAAEAKRLIELVNGGTKRWEAEAMIAIERADTQTDLGRVVSARRASRDRMTNLEHERDAARNRAWKR